MTSLKSLAGALALKNLAFLRPYPKKDGQFKQPKRLQHETLIQHDAEAALEFAKGVAGGEEVSRLAPTLFIKNAIMADKQYQALKDHFVEVRTANNKRLLLEIKELNGQLKAEQARELKVAPAAEEILLGFGLTWTGPGVFSFPLDVGRYSLESIAGKNSILLAKNPNPRKEFWGNLGLNVVSGIVFGASLGMLTDTLNMNHLRSEGVQVFAWSAIGVGVIAAIGYSIADATVTVGHMLFTAGWSKRATTWIAPVTFSVLLAATVLLYGLVEPNVEKAGLLKAFTEKISRQGVSLSPFELFIVSLVVVLPVICCHLHRGLLTSFGMAARRKVVSLQSELIESVTKDEQFKKLTTVCPELGRSRQAIIDLKAKVEACEEKIRHDFSEAELDALQLQGDLALDYSLEAKLVSLPGYYEQERVAKVIPTRRWWMRAPKQT